MSAEGKNLGGRPRIEIDLDDLAEMCKIQCTAEECASLLRCSVDTIDLRLKEAGYAGFTEFYEENSAFGKKSLRRAQWYNATVENNATMQIWLGKQVLGQRDHKTLDLGNKDDKPFQTEETASARQLRERLLSIAERQKPEGEE